MAIKKILIEPDPLLRKISESIEKVDDDLRKLMDDMLETMYQAPGIGLAAVQVGILKRIIVIDISKGEVAAATTFLIISGEVLFLVSIALLGKDAWEHIKAMFKRNK